MEDESDAYVDSAYDQAHTQVSSSNHLAVRTVVLN